MVLNHLTTPHGWTAGRDHWWHEISAGAPDDVAHPRYIDQYLKMNTFSGAGELYPPYRAAMLNLIK